ncbi:MAG: DNA-directed RNA polymerase subunit alpha [Bacteroidetes bacterium 4572_128]|nr:MAG: DNA-directed RNA polymerase subunit alpha [Bacteroidetes bacterium 4572_128]
MAILAFQKPEQVKMIESSDTFGKFEFRPLEPGYGVTIGNALRRILLSSLEGYAITSIKLEGISHEFSTITGVIEDVTEIILNLKQIRFKQKVEECDEERVTVNFSDTNVFKAGDLAKFITGFEILNSELEICHLEKDVKINMEFFINKGRGYVPSEENKPQTDEMGIIPIDAIFTPIKNVKFSVVDFRVEQKTDYEKLLFEIKTDGSITPKNALKEAAKILIHHFMLFSDEKITMDVEKKVEREEFDEEVLHMRQLLKTKLVDMDLSVRALNCLKTADVETLSDLVVFDKTDLLKFRNFGKKSLTELDELLDNLKLSFGMNIEKYEVGRVL